MSCSTVQYTFISSTILHSTAYNYAVLHSTTQHNTSTSYNPDFKNINAVKMSVHFIV